jgi:hypothetical protein
VTRYKDKWFQGEHDAIVERETFEAVQELLKSNSSGRKVHRASTKAPFMGKLYDDRGNRMSPSYSTKNGIRYSFYVSSALLRGKKGAVGTIGRVAAHDIESTVLRALSERSPIKIGSIQEAAELLGCANRIEVHSDHLLVNVKAGSKFDPDAEEHLIIPWTRSKTDSIATVETGGEPVAAPNTAVLQAVVRSHIWLRALQDGSYQSVEELAEASALHPKVIRLGLRLAFLSPTATAAILMGNPLIQIDSLASIPNALPLSWTGQHHALG